MKTGEEGRSEKKSLESRSAKGGGKRTRTQESKKMHWEKALNPSSESSATGVGERVIATNPRQHAKKVTSKGEQPRGKALKGKRNGKKGQGERRKTDNGKDQSRKAGRSKNGGSVGDLPGSS